ncbi:hypothetical protein DOM21_11970 [Bacteriovorax stolpii]|uniref:Uncharacterized protein n=1 Tax=Bacteriovorax stolpii TaxID=960 RepID=A0A2K9NSZ5_BACTC|nr:hypothetical protein [Bacteriovorax stolpii]AUN97864.1 hypothetical protein C0V70_07030 [Bacteriovorax stolpii]QDK42150.1 hypothetical protein DOM21_11970 [Bacteriovorax stolpii]TDP51694.1 hypothetical protein C8D79_3138 [Bacteriovorax stolpii]
MKLAPKVILLILILISILMDVRPLHAAGKARDCEGMNHPAYQDEYRACLRLQIAESAGEAGVDCIDCIFQQKDESNGIVEALGVIAQPLAYLAGTYTVAKYQHETQKKWAEAYASGFTECTNRYNSYLNYNTTIGANPITASEANAFSSACNGYGYGSYAGYGGMMSNGYGGYGNPFQSNGFSSGFMSGYGGGYWGSSMYGMPSMYNTGMMSGSIGIGGYLGTTSSSSIYQNGVSTAFGF